MRASPLLFLLASAAALLVGCGDDGLEGSNRPRGFTDFVSDNPSAPGQPASGWTPNGVAVGVSVGTGGDEDMGTGGGSAGGHDPPPSAPSEPERLIAEADIVQVHDGVLYALSRYSGLTIVDVSGDDLVVLGRKALGGTPFEMYLRGGVVYAMFSDWSHYVGHGDGSWDWTTTSHLEALDVADPASIASLGSFELPGSIADSRMVGDVIYAVTFEDGSCWRCDVPATVVTSISVGAAGEIGVLDRLALDEPNADFHGWSRSVTVNQERMYIGGVDWSTDVGDSSTIDVVDISDVDGALRRGTTVEVDGQIEARWQMDEYDGVLRVVSQPWDPSVNPSIQTFAVTSAEDIRPLGRGELELPRRESLRAVRFDGDRGYAITAVDMEDPLFTIDLSDPASPRQMGELELPGFIWHIEPRGDRLLTLGFDAEDAEGGLHVSLYDVGDLAAPTELRRIPFGGSGSALYEDQNRIHKLFGVDAERGLVLVPFTSWSWDDEGECSTYGSGIQLVDWRDDDLVRRGVAPIRGEARRAFIVGDRLFALSDEQLRTFDFSDRDAPEKNGELQLATHASKVAVGETFVARLAADWWTREPRLDIVDVGSADSPDPIGSVGLGDMLAAADGDDACVGWGHWDARLFVRGHHVYLVWPAWHDSVARVAVIDASDPAAPRLASHLDVPVDTYTSTWNGYDDGHVVADGEPVVQIGSTLVFLHTDDDDDVGFDDERDPSAVHAASLRIVDLSDADRPVVAASVALPDGAGHTKLVAHGTEVMLSHWEPLEDDPTRARFFLDRVDVSSAGGAKLLPSINIPGSLVAYDVASQNLLTVDYLSERRAHVLREDCLEQLGATATWTEDRWASTRGLCRVQHRKLRLTHVDRGRNEAALLDEEDLPDGVWFDRLHVGDDRVFTTSLEYVNEWAPESLVWAIGGVRAGTIRIGTKPIEEAWGASPLEAHGQRLVAVAWPGSILSVDGSDLAVLEVTKHEDLPWSIESVTMDGDRALAALGPYGLAVIPLD